MSIKTNAVLFLTYTFLSCTQLFGQSTRFAWAKSMGGVKDDRLEAIITDALGCVYTIGSFMDTVDFDPGPGTFNLISAGRDDVFLSKLDPDGNFVWARKIGAAGDDWGQAIYIDASGYVYISGEFDGTVDFDPGPAVNNLSSAGSVDVFIAKLDTAGNTLWAKKVGGIGHDYGLSIAADPMANVYVSGYFWNGTADFDPGPNTFNITSGSYFQAYFLKLDPDGNFLWAKAPAGGGHNYVQRMAVDSLGDVYYTGGFQGTVDFDPGANTFNLTAVVNDAFVLKLNTKGNFQWAKRLGGTGWDEGNDISLDRYGNVFSTGQYVETADFDPGAGQYNLTATGIDAYISKLDNNGNFIWAKGFGGTYGDAGNTVITDVYGDVYAAGAIVGRVDMDPGTDSSFLDAGYFNRNAFVSKFDSGGNFIWAKGFGGLSYNYGSFMTLDPARSVIAAGSFMDTGDFNPEPPVFDLRCAGDPDVYIVKLGQCSSKSFLTVSACESYLSPSYKHTWTTAGIYHDTIPNAAGCDSVITVNLTIRYNGASMTDVKTCDRFVSPSGKYTWTETGQYMDTIPGSMGCDSIILVNLEVLMGHLTVTSNSSTLTASIDSATYQWLDCNNAYAPVANATGKHFKPAMNGNYAVRVTKNACLDTSDCVNMTAVGLNEESFGIVKVFPNPTSGELSIDLSKVQSSIQVTITNLIGQEMIRQTFTQTDKLQLSIPGEVGIYFLELTDAGKHKVCLKVVKQ